MKIILGVLVGLLCVLPSKAKESAPKVQFYSRDPGYVGKENTLICHRHLHLHCDSPWNTQGIHLGNRYVISSLLQVCSVQAT
ncbi:hypothetical protein PBY51_008814 [Eleginops maclovinus]|uniref:Uncharacterized protein n=1 Tax=Eleginops maclovinus TaxID=56733 RepID=A0AAN7WV40_ELEMC|nr:hypothetical protein PBY51_008814 [Eleginops maclovinus]